MIDPKSTMEAAGGFLDLLKSVIGWFRGEKKSGSGTHPKRTLQIALMPDGSNVWQMGNRNERAVMQLQGRMLITNISAMPIRITQVVLRYGFFGRRSVLGGAMVSRAPYDYRMGDFDIPPNETRNLVCSFRLDSPPVDEKNPFFAHSIVLVDQLGNKHSVRRVKFAAVNPNARIAPTEPEEFPSEIENRIEREVVSILKAELARYEMCGRTVGGLGSVHLVYRETRSTGFGTEFWKPDSPTDQFLVTDPESASVESDNLAALRAVLARLQTEADRQLFVHALLERLASDRGYAAVSYFIVYALLDAGHMKEALEKARRDLPESDDRNFGLSNVLMLLNGLLRYRFPDFTDAMLDDIERFTKGMKAGLFRIPQKIAAIRAQRLGGSTPL